METMQTIKSFLAWLAGVPARSGARASTGPHPPPRPAQRSLLYAPDTIPAPPPAAPVASRRTVRQRDGDAGEAFARRHLERAGLVFVAANVRYRDGEIDLVMREPGKGSRGTSLVFVEVRRRARADHGGAAGSVTREKRRRVVAAAAHYLVGLGARTLPPCRFDVVTLDGDAQSGLRVQWLRDAFRDEG